MAFKKLFSFRFWTRTNHSSSSNEFVNKTCTIDWNGDYIVCENGYILPRDAEMIINAKYYPNGIIEYPIDPETGLKLEPYGNPF